MAGTKGQQRRFWSDEEKRSICMQTRASGTSVAQVARRHSMNSNLLFTWLRDPRFSSIGAKAPGGVDDDNIFLPVDVSASTFFSADGLGTDRSEDTRPVAQWIDIRLTDGRRILVEGPTSLSAVLGLIQGLLQ